jgi:hypothetical protein
METTNFGEFLAGAAIFVAAVYGTYRLYKYRKANKTPSTGTGGGGGKRPTPPKKH